MARSTACLLALALPSGCALGVQAPRPSRQAGTPPSCTATKTAVTADWIGAGAGLSLGVASADASARLAAVLLASGGLLAVSAFTGNRRANQCRDAYEAYFAEQRIKPPDSYGDYAVVADREAKRLGSLTATPPRPAATPPRPAATPPLASASDEAEADKSEDANHSPDPQHWNDFWRDPL